MGLRVTNAQVTEAFITQLFSQQSALEKARNQVSTGIKVSNPSDDPGRAGTISQFLNTVQRLDRHSERITNAEGLLQTQEGILDTATNLLIRAQELATQAANGSISVANRRTMAGEVFQIRDALVGLANTKYQGVYIYGGADDSDPPFDPSTYAVPTVPPANATDPETIRYIFDAEAGTSTERSVQITDSDTVRINTSGTTIFSNAIGGLERLGRALAGYRTDPQDLSTLPTGTGNAFNLPLEYGEQTQDILETIDLLSSARTDDIEVERTSIGGRINRLEQAKEVIANVKLNTQQAKSAIQDVDIVEAASRLGDLNLALRALLTSHSQVNNLSLLDFL